jgi:hypothetical protein
VLHPLCPLHRAACHNLEAALGGRCSPELVTTLEMKMMMFGWKQSRQSIKIEEENKWLLPMNMLPLK